jgi:UDP-2,3-diacylglucosamine pyrophosphatase LpxH
MEDKRIYIGDIHMNAGRGFNEKHLHKKAKRGLKAKYPPKKTKRGLKEKYPYEWLGPKEARRFADFLNYLYDEKTVREVVIIGDLMDNWVYPVDEEPPSLKEIVKATINKEIVKALKKLAAAPKIRVIYLPGNHDMGMTKELIEEISPDMVFGGTSFRNSVYRTSRLRAEHGSAHAMFNAPDPINGSVGRLPLGYFISRVIATKARDTGSGKRHYWSYADDLLEMLGPQRMAASVFEAVLEEAGLDETTDIVMPKRNGKDKIVTAEQVKNKYAALYDQWKEIHGSGMAIKALMAETGLLGRMADHLCKHSDTNIVVFGHSHDWKLDKDTWFVENRIYANCGTWCDEEKPCTWVESQKDRANNKHFVRVMNWNNGKPELLGEADVGL